MISTEGDVASKSLFEMVLDSVEHEKKGGYMCLLFELLSAISKAWWCYDRVM